MAKLIINIGLPASGKSTESEQKILREGNTVRINKDLLRTMLHFDKFNGRNEGLTRDASRTLAMYFLANGVNVIIDDTNLNPSTKQSWVDLAKQMEAKIEYLDMTHVSVEECLRRDQFRDKKVGSHVIAKMAMQQLDWLKGKRVVICDLDGTIANIDHRLQYASGETKDWGKFFAGIKDDLPRRDVLDQVSSLCAETDSHLIFVSARPENYREETVEWIAHNTFPLHFKYISPNNSWLLLMREANDKRDDVLVKSEIYDKYLKNLDIVAVFDDRPKVIRMWREKGLNTIDVGKGIEF
jgi:predicted kinase